MTFAPWSAAIVGFVSGGTYISVSYALEKVRLDDPMGKYLATYCTLVGQRYRILDRLT